MGAASLLLFFQFLTQYLVIPAHGIVIEMKIQNIARQCTVQRLKRHCTKLVHRPNALNVR